MHILEARLILSVFNIYFHVCYTISLKCKVWKGAIATACVTTSQTAATASFSSFLHTAEFGLTMFLLPFCIKAKIVDQKELEHESLKNVYPFNLLLSYMIMTCKQLNHFPWGCYFSLKNTKRKAGCTAVIPQRQSRP